MPTNPKTQATPGPWRVQHDERLHTSIIAAGPDLVARLSTMAKMEPAREANARLMAAAPQMREALEAMDRAFHHDTTGSVLAEDRAKACDMARAALRAANGEES